MASECFRLYAEIYGYDYPSRLLRSNRPKDPNVDKYQPRPDIVIHERNKLQLSS